MCDDDIYLFFKENVYISLLTVNFYYFYNKEWKDNFFLTVAVAKFKVKIKESISHSSADIPPGRTLLWTLPDCCLPSLSALAVDQNLQMAGTA